MAKSFEQISVVNEPGKIGKGGAIEFGMRMAKGDLIGFVDADCSTSPAMFFQLVENIGDAGCAIS